MSKTPREAVLVPVLLGVAAVPALIIALVVAGGAKSDAGSLPWILLAMGIAGVAIAVFDRQQKQGPGTGVRTKALLLLLGPTGARIFFALAGGGFLGGAIGLFAR